MLSCRTKHPSTASLSAHKCRAVIPLRKFSQSTSSPSQSQLDAAKLKYTQWTNGRLSRLRSPDGWLSVLSLSWLNPGGIKNTFGADSANLIHLHGYDTKKYDIPKV